MVAALGDIGGKYRVLGTDRYSGASVYARTGIQF